MTEICKCGHDKEDHYHTSKTTCCDIWINDKLECKCKKFEPKCNHCLCPTCCACGEKTKKGCGKRLRDGFRDASNCGDGVRLCIDCKPKNHSQQDSVPEKHDQNGTYNLSYMEMKYDDGTTYWEVWNKKNEELGFVFYNKKWKKWVWEQGMSIIMSWDCLQEVVDFMKQQERK